MLHLDKNTCYVFPPSSNLNVFVMIDFFLSLLSFLELREGASAQRVVALITLKYSEQVYVGMMVLVLFLLFLITIT